MNIKESIWKLVQLDNDEAAVAKALKLSVDSLRELIAKHYMGLDFTGLYRLVRQRQVNQMFQQLESRTSKESR